MTAQADPFRRTLLYRAGPGMGLGHFLVSVCVYAQYARQTHREFHILSRDWLLAIDPSADIDPFFTHFFDLSGLAEQDINLSKGKALASLRRIRNHDCSSVVIGDPKARLRRVRRAFSPSRRMVKAILGKSLAHMARQVVSRVDQATKRSPQTDAVNASANENTKPHRHSASRRELFANTGFLSIQEFRDYLRNGTDHPADYIVVDAVVPFESSESLSLFGRYTPFAPFKQELRFPGVNGLDLDNFVGIHARHGNGEYLSGRKEGDTVEFKEFLRDIENHVRRSTETKGVIAVSDSRKVVQHFGDTLGAVDISSEQLPDLDHIRLFRSQKGDAKRDMVSSVLRDIYILSRCRQVVCGQSLFTVAAYIFSRSRRFSVIEQYSS